MKLKKVAEACMWLPGFAPDEDPREVLGTLGATQAEAITDLVLRNLVVEAAAPAANKAVWPRLSAALHASLHGDVEKYEANLRAIELLRQLEQEERDPDESERDVLNLYTGWGGIAKAFNPAQSDTAWAQRSRQLESFLSAGELKAASLSTLNAHYTPVEVIDAMWTAVQRLGFNGGRIIEPAVGVGYFLGSMPSEIAQRSSVTAVEIDDVSARIAKKLYGSYGVRVLNCGFEAANTPKDFYDLAISNVPFDTSGVPEVRNVPYADFSIHNYFLAKALEVVRPGGLVAFITSSYTLDARSESVRSYLATQGDLVGAIRLPAGTFKKLGNTNVTTDIVFLQKRSSAKSGTSGVGYRWIESIMLPKSSPLCDVPWYARCTDIVVNEFFGTHPSAVIGKLSTEKSQYRDVVTCKFDGDIVDALKERVQGLPEGIYQEQAKKSGAPRRAEPVIQLDSKVRDGLAIIDGQVFEITSAEAKPYKATAKVLERIKGLIEIRDAARKLIAAQTQGDSDSMLSVYRTALAVSYDTFVVKHGYLGDKLNRQAFKADPDLPLLLSLELRDEEAQTVEKAPIFTRRTIGATRKVMHCETPREALYVSLAESARVQPARIAELLGRNKDEVMQELEQSGDVYLDPVTAHWVQADAYLSGNVREKLGQAQSSGERFARNVEALKQTLPEDLKPSEIIVRVGATWIPSAVYALFLNELTGTTGHKVEFDALTGTWNVETPYAASYLVSVTQQWGTSRVGAQRLFELALNQQEPSVFDKCNDKPVPNTQETIAAREKQYELKEHFATWLWSDTVRAVKLAQAYNDQFNCYVPRRYNGEHLALPGMSEVYTLRTHQRDAVWRVVSSEFNTLLAHAVGAGKTLEMICSAMELRRVGKASKPMIVVPNHLLLQIAGEFIRAYPHANILMASKEDLEGDRRKLITSRIATGDWDAVVLTHSSFERIALSSEYMREFIQEELDRVESVIRSRGSAAKSNRIVRQLARAKKTWEKKLKNLSGEDKKDDVLTFEDLGVDWLMYDEAHLAKNLYKFTKMERIAGLSNSNSERAFDLFTKTRNIMQSRGDDLGVTLSTATPCANSMGEIFTFQQFLQPQALRDARVENFDAWAANFGEAVTALELSPDGRGYRTNVRFSRFVNVADLMRMFWAVADIRTAEMLDLPVPKANVETIVAHPSAAVKAYIDGLVARAEKIRKGGVQSSKDNMLAVTTDGRKAALDLRLVQDSAEDYEGSKANLCARKVHEWWVKSADIRGAQLVFCDMSVPRTDGRFSVYGDLRDKLVALGIPVEEIAFIHDYETDAQKEALFAKVRAGTIRVLMGSTAKMGVGTNVQTRLVALHALDAPWRTCDVEQRDGRIVRQGNMNAEVWLYRYVTEQTMDAYVWQILETKGRFIAQVMSGNLSIRSAEDVALVALSYAEVKALASGNPLVLEKAGVDAELAKLTILRSSWANQHWKNRMEILNIPDRIQSAQRSMQAIAQDLATVNAAPSSDFSMEIGGVVFSNEEHAVKALNRALTGMPRSSGPVELGSYRGLMLCAASSETAETNVWLKGAYKYPLHGRYAVNIIDDMVAQIALFPRDIERIEGDIQSMADRLEALKIESAKPFDRQDRLDWLVARQREIEDALDLTKTDLTATDETADAEEAAVA